METDLSCSLELTLDKKIDRQADFTSDTIGHVAPEWPLVIPGHINYSESGTSVSELNPVTLCNLRAAVHPEERERGSRGGAGQTDGAASGLQNVCGAGIHLHVGYWSCGMKMYSLFRLLSHVMAQQWCTSSHLNPHELIHNELKYIR